MDVKNYKSEMRCGECMHSAICRYSEQYLAFIDSLDIQIKRMPDLTLVGSIITVSTSCSEFFMRKPTHREVF